MCWISSWSCLFTECLKRYVYTVIQYIKIYEYTYNLQVYSLIDNKFQAAQNQYENLICIAWKSWIPLNLSLKHSSNLLWKFFSVQILYVLRNISKALFNHHYGNGSHHKWRPLVTFGACWAAVAGDAEEDRPRGSADVKQLSLVANKTHQRKLICRKPFSPFLFKRFFFWCRLETPYNHCINEGPSVDRLNLLAFWRQNEQDVCCPHAQQTTANLVASAGGFGYRVVFLPGKNSTVIFRPRVQVNLFVYLKQNTQIQTSQQHLLNKNSM